MKKKFTDELLQEHRKESSFLLPFLCRNKPISVSAKPLTNFKGYWSIRTSLKLRQRGHWPMAPKSLRKLWSRAVHRVLFSKNQGLSQKELGTRWPLTGVSRALRARNPEKVWKKSLGASAPGASGESGKSLEKSFRTFSRLFPDSRDFSQTFFQIFSGFSGPEGPRDPCKWPTGSQKKRSFQKGPRSRASLPVDFRQSPFFPRQAKVIEGREGCTPSSALQASGQFWEPLSYHLLTAGWLRLVHCPPGFDIAACRTRV